MVALHYNVFLLKGTHMSNLFKEFELFQEEFKAKTEAMAVRLKEEYNNQVKQIDDEITQVQQQRLLLSDTERQLRGQKQELTSRYVSFGQTLISSVVYDQFNLKSHTRGRPASDVNADMQMKLLTAIEAGHTTLNDISRATGINYQSVANYLRRLVTAKLIIRVASGVYHALPKQQVTTSVPPLLSEALDSNLSAIQTAIQSGATKFSEIKQMTGIEHIADNLEALVQMNKITKDQDGHYALIQGE